MLQNKPAPQRSQSRSIWISLSAVFAVLVLLPDSAVAQSAGLPAFNVTAGADGEQTYSLSLQILALMSSLAILPSLLLGLTSFTRIMIVLSILRQAL